MSYAIEIQNLTKKFGKLVAVDGLDLQVPKGSIFAFLGPNGAGKTTTINMMMDIISPTKGTISVLGVDSKRLSSKEVSQIGYVSENQELLEWMTVEQLINYCKPMYSTWDDKFCKDLLKQFDIPYKQKIKTFSRGMKMKTALVSSLSFRPKLLILDEPFSGLDPVVREEFIDGLLEITQNQEWTIFISSHDIHEVERLADWVGIIHLGKKKLVEESESLQRRFRTVEVILKKSINEKINYPEEWLSIQDKDRIVNFVDSQYSDKQTQLKIKELFPDHSDITVTGMSLREIFVILAKQYRMVKK
ncbi:MAG: ABC transporter ATP-binding protein [Candidatus Omnitrophica bacterium]|nr:ABC transporter ATP-binding protein [Candidatus Omnitrophota bacterium]MBU1997664.1 ABC transporter ATP-binding protein [Candidatus Omnitrophota bacterium]